MADSFVGAKILPKMWEGAHWEGVWPCLDPWDGVRTASTYWNVPGKHGPHDDLFFFSIKEGARGFLEGSAVQALCHCGITQGLCADWFAPFGSRR